MPATLGVESQQSLLTAGVRVRPVPSVAIKIDGSSHLQTYNGALEYYPEIRASFSYYWTMPGLER